MFLATNVFPTPLSPIKRNDAGLLCFNFSTFLLMIDFEISDMAFSCPITSEFICSSNFFKSTKVVFGSSLRILPAISMLLGDSSFSSLFFATDSAKSSILMLKRGFLVVPLILVPIRLLIISSLTIMLLSWLSVGNFLLRISSQTALLGS